VKMELNKKLMKHFLHPKNVGKIKNGYYGKVENPVCGDVTEMWVKIEDGKIKDAKFKTFGCFVTITAASAFTEKIKNQELQKLFFYKKNKRKIIEKFAAMIRKELGNIPRKKWHCPPASIEAFLKCVQQYYQKKHDKEKSKEIKKLLKIIKTCYIA